jgi:hypothetical protein
MIILNFWIFFNTESNDVRICLSFKLIQQAFIFIMHFRFTLRVYVTYNYIYILKYYVLCYIFNYCTCTVNIQHSKYAYDHLHGSLCNTVGPNQLIFHVAIKQ